MKRILPVLVLVLLFLNACTPISSSISSVQVLQTSIALTQAANPTKTPGQLTISTPTSLPSMTPTLLASVTSTGLPSPTATVAPPTATAAPPPAASTWSPAYADQFIHYYFQHINARDYTTTWSLLTDSFIAYNNSPAQGGYTGYVNFWNTVQRVDVLGVSVTSLSGYYAEVSVNMVYNYYNGIVVGTLQPFHLYYDAYRGTWMFHTYSATMPTYPSTPSQFIHYYYNNINLRNYGLTWSLLTDSFINNNNSPEQGGYEGYVGYWNTIARVDVNYVTITSQSGDYAHATVGLTFNKTDGTVVSLSLPYHLVYNYTIGNWQFYSP